MFSGEIHYLSTLWYFRWEDPQRGFFRRNVRTYVVADLWVSGINDYRRLLRKPEWGLRIHLRRGKKRVQHHLPKKEPDQNAGKHEDCFPGGREEAKADDEVFTQRGTSQIHKSYPTDCLCHQFAIHPKSLGPFTQPATIRNPRIPPRLIIRVTD